MKLFSTSLLLVVAYLIIAASPGFEAVAAPVVSSISPSSYQASNSDQTMTINGSGFVSGATLTFDPPSGANINSNASKLTFVSSSQIRYQINNGSDVGTWTVRVNNPNGQSSSAASFTVTAVPGSLSITSVSPSSMPSSNTNQTLTINGSGFVSGATLTFDPPTGANINSNASKLTFISSNQISYQINNSGDLGAWTVRVNNPNGQPSNTLGFTVVAGGPTLSVSLSANPSSGGVPLDGVSLTASVSGTATGTINYTFYCNRSDAGTNILPGFALKIDGTTDNSRTAADVCNYGTAGTFTAKVVAEREGLQAEARFTVVSAGSTGFSLSFPLAGQTPFSAAITSVFDHSMVGSYAKDDIVVAFDGEEGRREHGTDGQNPPGFRNAERNPFLINVNYTGAGSPFFLNYDGHPGIDYRAPKGTALLATADGVVHYPSSIPGLNSAALNHTLAIDHGNGYVTYFLHCLTHPSVGNQVVAEGATVHRGQLVAYSGDANTGSPPQPHLHLEIHHNGVPVDPYGWSGFGSDPYTAASNTNLWVVETPTTFLTAAQVAQVAYSVGFRGGPLVNAIAVAGAESNFDQTAQCFNCVEGFTEDSRGLWQINSNVHTQYDRQLLLQSADYNARAAYAISRAAVNIDWNPWSTFANERFTAFLNQARAAAQDVDPKVIRSVNDRVSAGRGIPVYSAAGNVSPLRTVTAGTSGFVLEGPRVSRIGATPGPFVWWKVRWTDGSEGWSVEDYMARVGSTNTPPPPAVLNTSAGTNVTVQGNGAQVTFANVPASGMTTVSGISPTSVGQLPTGYQLPVSDIAYEISTSAVVQPPITTCFSVPADIDESAFSLLRVLHKENGILIDRTTTKSIADRLVCGNVSLLSPLLVALKQSAPVAEPAFFVRQHYLDFLSRQPDQSGLDFWTNEITSCGTNQACIELKRINVSAAYFLSIEFQQTGYLVERVYKTAYGDATATSTLGGAHQLAVPVVRFEEFRPDTEAIGRSVIIGESTADEQLENNKRAFMEEFVRRARFTAAFPDSLTPAQFVDTLNTNAGNPLSTAERNQLSNDLTSGAKTRAQALRAVAEDPDLVRAESNRAFVLMQYFGYLRRNPNGSPDADYTGYDFWLSKLNQFNGNFVNAEMVKAFIVSSEYRQRFGP